MRHLRAGAPNCVDYAASSVRLRAATCGLRELQRDEEARDSERDRGSGRRVRSLADRFGIEPGMVVMEMGYDDDVDEDLRDALIDRVR